VALYEALYAQPAFPGSNSAERIRTQREGQLTPPPAKTEVPNWVTRAVLQGLSTDPLRRPPSMQALLKALEADPARKRRAWLGAAALASLGGTLAALALWGLVRQQQPQPGCSHMEQRLEGIWDSALKARVRQALVGTGLPYARDSAARVEAALQAYADTWVRRRVEACEAARAQAGQSQSLALLQEYCLERRRSQLRALTELLARGPDRELLEKAVQVARSLPPLESCAEARAPLLVVPLPATFEARAHAEALQEQVDRLEALYEAGKYKEGLALAEELLRQAADAQLEPLRARTLYLAARLQEATGDYKGAEARLREALPLASAQGDHPLLARAWSLLMALVGDKQGRPQEARALELAVAVAVAGTQDELARAESLGNLGTVLKALGSYEPALARHEQALALRRKALGPEHPLVALSLNNLGNVLRDMGRHPEARAHYEQALALRQRALGPEHPLVAQSLNNLGTVLWTLGRYQQAREHFEQALALRQKVLGPEHPQVAQSLNNLAGLLSTLGRYEEARGRYAQALAVWSKTLQPEHPNVAASLTSLGTVLSGLGRHGEAQTHYERALAMWQQVLGPEHPNVAWPLLGLGRTLVRTGALREAEQHLQRARALQEKALGSSHPALAETLLGLGELRLAQRRPAEARPLLERALPLIQAELRAEVQLALAQALWEEAGDRQRARGLASEAQAYWQQLGHPRLAEASQWLGSHPAP
jgi:eukaryotic-like serine/threonine-protein kinase